MVEIARRLGCDRSWLYRIEMGTHGPQYEFVERAAAVFGRHIEELRCGLLPQRIDSLSQRQQAALDNAVSAVPKGILELSYGTAAVRLPRLDVLEIVSNRLKMPVDLLLYGSDLDDSEIAEEK